MSTKNPSAFDSLDARASVNGQANVNDRISLRDHIVTVEIGAFQAERGTTQRVSFDVVVEVAPPPGPIDDHVDRILSYDTITQAISHELAAGRLNLLETLAERICQRILAEPQAQRVHVRIQKLDRGPGALGVEIVRSKATGEQDNAPTGVSPPDPWVVFLSNAAIASQNLSGWIDNLGAMQKPVILCVGAGDVAAPVSDAKPTQRHIDLLAVDQNAWVLAGRDARCVVVDTKTELDWGLRNNQISVWAPSRIILDAVDAPPIDPMALVQWFAGQMGAECLVLIGAPAVICENLAVMVVPIDHPGI